MVDSLSALNPIDEDHGVLALEDIRSRCSPILERCGAEFCYLFGSYAKGKARPGSDVDLVVSTAVTGLRYYGMIEELRTALRKRADALDLAQLSGNAELIREVLKDGGERGRALAPRVSAARSRSEAKRASPRGKRRRPRPPSRHS